MQKCVQPVVTREDRQPAPLRVQSETKIKYNTAASSGFEGLLEASNFCSVSTTQVEKNGTPRTTWNDNLARYQSSSSLHLYLNSLLAAPVNCCPTVCSSQGGHRHGRGHHDHAANHPGQRGHLRRTDVLRGPVRRKPSRQGKHCSKRTENAVVAFICL